MIMKGIFVGLLMTVIGSTITNPTVIIGYVIGAAHIIYLEYFKND